MNWGQLFCGNCSGAFAGSSNGLLLIWNNVAALLNWDILKGLIAFTLAVYAVGHILALFRGVTHPRLNNRLVLPGGGVWWASDKDMADLRAAGWSTSSGKPSVSQLSYLDESGEETASTRVETYGEED